jgi:hypothetical protein
MKITVPIPITSQIGPHHAAGNPHATASASSTIASGPSGTSSQRRIEVAVNPPARDIKKAGMTAAIMIRTSTGEPSTSRLRNSIEITTSAIPPYRVARNVLGDDRVFIGITSACDSQHKRDRARCG